MSIDKSKFSELPLKPKPFISLSLAGLAILGTISVYVVKNYTAKQEATKSDISVSQPAPIKAVTALGRIEPEGEAINLSPSPDLGGTKIGKLLVKEGERVSTGQIIAILDNYNRAQAAVELAKQEVKVAEANLAIVLAGAKQGEIQAQGATIDRVKAQLQGEIAANQAQLSRLQAQLRTETNEKQATVDRLQAELRNAESEFSRYQQLAQDGVISESELDSRSLAVATAKERLVEAQATYSRTVATLKEEIRETQAIDRQDIDTLQAQIVEAEANLDRIAEVRDVDVLQAQAQIDRAVAALKQAEEDWKLTQVIAPTNGQILKINAYPGESVDTDGVVEFGQTDRMLVVAEVYESDINQVQLGQKASIISETGAFSGKITGKVSHVGLKIGKQDVLNTDPAADVDSRVVEVKIRLDESSSQKVSNLTNSKAIVKIAVDSQSFNNTNQK